MEVEKLCSVSSVTVQKMVCCSLVGAAQKSLLLLLLLCGTVLGDINAFPSPLETDKRFPFGDLKKDTESGEENKDAGESDDDDDDDDDDVDDDDGDDDDGDFGEDGVMAEILMMRFRPTVM